MPSVRTIDDFLQNARVRTIDDYLAERGIKPTYVPAGAGREVIERVEESPLSMDSLSALNQLTGGILQDTQNQVNQMKSSLNQGITESPLMGSFNSVDFLRQQLNNAGVSPDFKINLSPDFNNLPTQNDIMQAQALAEGKDYIARPEAQNVVQPLGAFGIQMGKSASMGMLPYYWKENQPETLNEMRQLEQEYPTASMAGNIAGFLLPTTGIGGAVGALPLLARKAGESVLSTLAKKAATGALTLGTVEASNRGFNAATNDLPASDVALEAAKGFGTGALFGGIAGPVSMVAEGAGSSILSKMPDVIKNSLLADIANKFVAGGVGGVAGGIAANQVDKPGQIPDSKSLIESAVFNAVFHGVPGALESMSNSKNLSKQLRDNATNFSKEIVEMRKVADKSDLNTQIKVYKEISSRFDKSLQALNENRYVGSGKEVQELKNVLNYGKKNIDNYISSIEPRQSAQMSNLLGEGRGDIFQETQASRPQTPMMQLNPGNEINVGTKNEISRGSESPLAPNLNQIFRPQTNYQQQWINSLKPMSQMKDIQTKNKPVESPINRSNQDVTNIPKNEMQDIRFSADDIPYKLAYNAFQGMSHDPESRAKSEQKAYVDNISRIVTTYLSKQMSPEQRAAVTAAVDNYKNTYLKFRKDFLNSHQGYYTANIAGPSKFPVAKMDKKFEVIVKKGKAFSEALQKAELKIKKAAAENMTSQEVGDAIFTKLQKEIDSTVQTLKQIESGQAKGYSPELFKKSLSDKLKRVADAGNVEQFSKALEYLKDKQKELKKPVLSDKNLLWNYAGAATKAQAERPKGQEEFNQHGIKVVQNHDADRVQIFFDGKPGQEVIKDLKSSGWNWSPSNGAWQRKNTDNAMISAKNILDKHFKSENKVIKTETEATNNQVPIKEDLDPGETVDIKDVDEQKSDLKDSEVKEILNDAMDSVVENIANSANSSNTPNTGKFKKGDVKIMINTVEGHKAFNVPGEVYKGLGVSPELRLKLDDSESLKNVNYEQIINSLDNKTYVIVHLDSGYKIMSTGKRDVAKKIALNIADAIDFSLPVEDLTKVFKDDDFQAFYKDIVKYYEQGNDKPMELGQKITNYDNILKALPLIRRGEIDVKDFIAKLQFTGPKVYSGFTLEMREQFVTDLLTKLASETSELDKVSRYEIERKLEEAAEKKNKIEYGMKRYQELRKLKKRNKSEQQEFEELQANYPTNSDLIKEMQKIEKLSNRLENNDKRPSITVDIKGNGSVTIYNNDRDLAKAVDLFKAVLPVESKKPEYKNYKNKDNRPNILKEDEVGYSPSKKREPVKPFFSKLQQTIEAKMPNKAEPNLILNMISKAGVKEEEIRWSGITDFLRGKDKVNKAELLEFLRMNEIQIEEVSKGDKATIKYSENDRKILEKINRNSERLLNKVYEIYKNETNKDPGFIFFDQDTITIRKKLADDIKDDEKLQKALYLMDEVEIDERDRDEIISKYPVPNPKYSSYTIPYGENYRELLFQLETSESTGRIEKVIKAKKAEFNELDKRLDPNNNSFKGMTENEILDLWDRYRELEAELQNLHTKAVQSLDNNFRQHHWDEPDVLAHVRFNDRTDAEGNKVLFIEEIQSDWHQAGRKKGYKGDVTLPEGWKLITNNGRWEILDDTGRLMFFARTKKDVLDNYTWNDEYKHSEKVPDAPFRKTWHEFVLKRMLRYAAEHGYDKIAWTSGDMQNNRYKLSSYIDKLTVYKHKGRKVYFIIAKKKGDSVFNDPEVPENKLSELLGVEMANKILNNENEMSYYKDINGNYETKQQFTGIDLEIGGKGMKGFYDKMIPDFLNQYGKRWGAKVGITEIDLFDFRQPESREYIGPNYTLQELDDFVYNHPDLSDVAISSIQKIADDMETNFTSFKEAIEEFGGPILAKILGGKMEIKFELSKIQSIPITESMKESVLYEGQSMFEKKQDYKPMLIQSFPEYNESKNGKEMLKLAEEAIEDLQGEKTKTGSIPANGRRVGGINTSGISTLGKAFTTQFIKKGYVNLTGQKIKNYEDLAIIAQVFRDPRYETFRIVYMKGNKIINYEGVTASLPAQCPIIPGAKTRSELLIEASKSWRTYEEVALDEIDRQIEELHKRVVKMGADGFYIIHNHPSGKPNPSAADVNITKRISEAIPGFKGHIILDSNEYAVIDTYRRLTHDGNPPKNARIEYFDKDIVYKVVKISPDKQTPEKHLVTEIDHPLLGYDLKNVKGEITSDKIGYAALNLKNDKNVISLVYVGSKGIVNGVQEIPEGMLKDRDKLKGFLKNRAKDFGATMVFAVTNKYDVYRSLIPLIDRHYITDVVRLTDKTPLDDLLGRGYSTAAEKGYTITPGDFMGKHVDDYPTTRVFEDESKYNLTSFNPFELPPASGSNTSGKAKRASEIIKEFEDKFMTKVRNGRVRRANVLGYFTIKAQTIRLKKANDIPTFTHEAGHLIDKLYGIRDKTQSVPGIDSVKLRKELIALGRGSSPAKAKDDYLFKEGIAEFLRVYLTDQPQAFARAPETFEYFKAVLDPDLMNWLNAKMQDISNLVNLSPEDRIMMDVVDRGEIKPDSNVKQNLEHLYADWIDEYYPVYKDALELGGKEGEKKIKEIVAATRGFEATAMFSINPKGEKGMYQTDLYGNNVGPSLYDIMEPLAGDKKKAEYFWKSYAVARRAEDYHKRNMQLPNDWETYQQARINLEKKYPDFPKIFDNVRRYDNNLLLLLNQSGFISGLQMDNIKQLNPNHINLFRVRDAVEVATNSTRSKPIKRAYGGGEDIINPFESLVNQTFIIWGAAKRQQLLLEMAKLADKAEGKGRIMERAPFGIKMTEFNLDEFRKKIIQALLDQGVNLDDFYKGFDIDLHIDVLVKLFRPNYRAGNNQLIIYKAGKPVLYDIEPEAYETLAGLNPAITNTFMEILMKVGDFQAASVLYTPRFVAWNTSRETFTSWLQTRAGITFTDIAKGALSVLRKDEWYREAMKRGGTSEMFLANEDRFAKDVIGDLLRGRKWYNNVIHKIQHPLNTIREIIQFTELGTKVAESKKTVENKMLQRFANQIGKPKFITKLMRTFDPATRAQWNQFFKISNTTVDDWDEAIYNMRDLTYDIKRTGRKMRQWNINRIWRFSKAYSQGIDQMIRTGMDPKRQKRLFFRGLLLMIFSIGLYQLVKDNPWFKNLNPYAKDNFWQIPIGDPKTTKLFYPIPKPYEWSLPFTAIPVRLIDGSINDNPQAWEGFSQSIANNFMFDFAPMPAQPIIEEMTGEGWQGIPIENMRDKKLSPYLRYDSRTSETAKAIAGVTKGLPEWDSLDFMRSPKRIDHILKGYTGTWGKTTLGAIDDVAGKSNYSPSAVLESIPYLGNLKDVPGINSVSASFFTDAERASTVREQYYDKKEMYERAHFDLLEKGVKPNVEAFNEALDDLRQKRKKITDEKAAAKYDKKIDELKLAVWNESMYKAFNKAERDLADMRKAKEKAEERGGDKNKVTVRAIDSAMLGVQKGLLDYSRRVESAIEKRKAASK